MAGYLNGAQMGQLLISWGLLLALLSPRNPSAIWQVLLFCTLPLLLSSWQLFLFGTYLHPPSSTEARRPAAAAQPEFSGLAVAAGLLPLRVSP